MSRKKRRKGRGQEGSPEYWQSDDYNKLCYNVNLDMLLAIAINRFRWVGLPDTCDPRFLEIQLHRSGIATIAHAVETPDIWQSLMAAPQGVFNEYGLPTKWLAKGYEKTQYIVTPANGELVYYSQSRLNPWGAIIQYAVKLTHIQRTHDINLFHQHKPYVMVAPQEKKLELVNVLKQVSGYEPAILGDQSLLQLNEGNVFTLDTKVPYIGKELSESYQNILNQYLLFMGVPHVMFEKNERMITEEAQAGNSTTNILLKNCLDSRRWACEKLKKLSPETFGDTYVYLNDDWESYNYNYLNNAESLDKTGSAQTNANTKEENSNGPESNSANE